MNFKKRTHNCGELDLKSEGKEVTLNGWVAGKRNLGGIIFLDIRDRYGITQLKVSPDNEILYSLASKLGLEYVISASGVVIKRFSINKYLPTGEIEIDTSDINVLNKSEVTPFVIEDDVKASDELKLQYRYLDLRRHSTTHNLILRSNAYKIVRDYYHNKGFLEIETPILMKSTPEGARDYLVPSRIHKGKFYALPQSPQTYKQILMVSGLDKYIQICKCFRDEDLRADRQPEFTQIDVEMSFVTQDDVLSISEGLFTELCLKTIGKEIDVPFNRITYDEAICKYGTDKPDFRIKDIMIISEISGIFGKTEFKLFSNAILNKRSIAGFKINKFINKKSPVEITRKVLDSFNEFVRRLGFDGIVFMKCDKINELSSSINKFLSENEIQNLMQKFKVQEGDYVFIMTGEKVNVQKGLGQLRTKIAEDFNLLDDNEFQFLWVTDFPLFQYDENEKRFIGEHHVFTSPKDEYFDLLDSDTKEDIESIRANCYDLVLNGNEIGSGSIRIHDSDVQNKVFRIIGLNEEEIFSKFGYLLEAFRYGAPPHGGIAFGFDRIVAVFCGTKSIKDVIAFPKTVSAMSLMDNCPSQVAKEQLEELGIMIKSGK